MVAHRSRRRGVARSRQVLQKPHGVIHPRVQQVGPEHFGIVSVDCAKARFKWMLGNFYGDVLVPPTTVAHIRPDLEAAVTQLRQAVEHVEQQRSPRDATLDLAAARDFTTAFLRLRPLYPLDRQCLFEALALIEFLARSRIHPSWVFGVRLDPWRAHCWVQHGDVLFNDSLDEVLQYTPIMAA